MDDADSGKSIGMEVVSSANAGKLLPRRKDRHRRTAKVAGFVRELPLWGRPFEAQDQSCHVAIMNEEAASTLFGPDTVGMAIQDPDGAPVEIIGVVKPAFTRYQARSAFADNLLQR